MERGKKEDSAACGASLQPKGTHVSLLFGVSILRK